MSVFSLKNGILKRDQVSWKTGLNFEVAAGEVVQIGGENGSGKSTLLRAMAGFPGVSLGGEVEFMGGELPLKLEERVRAGIYLVYQQPVALPGVSVLAFLRAMRAAKLGREVGYGELYAEVRPLLARLGWEESILNKAVHVDFSGGEKKRLELLFLMWAQPKLALVDELEAGLDQKQRALAGEILKELLAKGMGMVLVTHEAEFARIFKIDQRIDMGS
jgi:Fe-S cluster assembly ATP-binding protein